MKRMKKFLAGMIAGVMCAGALPLAAVSLPEMALSVSAEDLKYGKLSYDENADGTIKITDCDESASGKLEIPAEIDGKPVTGIGAYAFFSCKGLTGISIPDRVISIEERAFWDCASLTEITIPKSVTSIGKHAFAECANLTKVTISEGVKSIGNSAFEECTSLTEITIPESMTSIGDYAFQKCTSLTEITISEGATSIGNYAFHSCTSLTEISIPESVESIGDLVFYKTPWLDLMQEKDPLVIINDILVNAAAYQGSELVIPDTVTKIAGRIFVDNHNGGSDDYPTFDRIVVPDHVTHIGNHAFAYVNAEQIELPQHLDYLGYGAFQHNNTLTSITIPEGVTVLQYFDTNANFPEGILSYCSGLHTVTLPSTLKKIEYGSFEGCSSLSDVYFTGTKEQWENVRIDHYDGFCGSNAPLLNAVIHFADGTQTVRKGDIDGNDTLNATDVAQILTYIARLAVGMDTTLTDDQLAAADIDGNGEISSKDAAYLLTFIAQDGAGMEPSWDTILGK